MAIWLHLIIFWCIYTSIGRTISQTFLFHKKVISEELGMKLEKTSTDMLGRAKKITISKDDTIILDGGGDKQAIEERCEQVYMKCL